MIQKSEADKGIKYQQNLLDRVKKTKDQHFTMAGDMQNILQKQGFNTKLINDTDFTKKDAEDSDLVVAFGGDFTYQNIHSKVENPEKTAFLGINTLAEFQKEALCEHRLDFNDHNRQIGLISECLQKAGTEDESDNIEWKTRSRLAMRIQIYSGFGFDQEPSLDN